MKKTTLITSALLGVTMLGAGFAIAQDAPEQEPTTKERGFGGKGHRGHKGQRGPHLNGARLAAMDTNGDGMLKRAMLFFAA